MLALGTAGGGYWYWTHRAPTADAVVADASPASQPAASSMSAASLATVPASTASAASSAQEATPSAPDIGTVAVKDIAFEQYKTDVYTGPTVLPDFNGAQKQFRDYRTRITEGAKEGVNFAGHYHVVTFGCGTECQTGYVIDERSGDVYNLGFGGEDQLSLSLGTRPDSTLAKATYYDGKVCRDEAAKWDGARFRVITRQSRVEPGPDPGMGWNCSSGDQPVAVPPSNGTGSESAESQAVPPAQQPAVERQVAAEPARVNSQRQQAVQPRSGLDSAARQMLADGQACFDRQDYTCAITNAGNALRIKPGYTAAESLKSRAAAAQAQAMDNIDIH